MNILYLTESPNSATSFYRGAGVLKHLSGIMDLNYDVVNPNNTELSWHFMMKYDVVWCERPASDKMLFFCENFKKIGVPIIVDYDDALFDVPPENAAYLYYNKENIKSNIKKFIKLANKVVVSTYALKKYFRADAIVIRNTLNFDLLDKLEIGKTERLDYIYWRGSETHAADIYHFRNELNIKSVNIFFQGFNPHYLTCRDNIHYRPLTDIINYFIQIKQEPPRLMIVPLVDNVFNRCKSNIAALEGVFFGTQVLAPNFSEWQIEGILNYTSNKDFKNKLFDCQINPKSLEFVKNYYNLTYENVKRKNLLNEI